MSSTAPLSSAVSRLWLPRLSLTACVRAAMGRDTRAVTLSDAQRFNHFPATPLCSISWWISGQAEALEPGATADLAAPRKPLPVRVLFGGPQSQPVLSWNPGPVHALMLVLAPDALHLLTGIDIARWVDGWAVPADVFPPDWIAMCEAVLQANDDDDRVRIIEDFLEPRWKTVRPASALGVTRVRDWAQGLAIRAASSAPGRSLRQAERRIKRWTGQPMRELRGLGRAEQAFFETLLAHHENRLQWTDVAANAGYSDQSHLCRETRRVTGFAPEDLMHRIENDETFWPYRIWM